MEFKGVSFFPHHGPIMYSCSENDDDTVVPQYNERPRDWQTLFAITIEVLVYRGSFSLYFTIVGTKKIIRYVKDFII